MIMPFGIPSEDFHGGFGLPHDDDCIEECIHTPEKTGAAMKHLSELMDKHRAEHPEVYIADAEARELLTRSLEMLYILGYDSSFTNPAIDTLTTDIKKFLEDME
jgi:hypothetical protein